MRKNATWGGHIELQAMSVLHQVNIVVHQLATPRWEIANFPGNRSIHLSYHRGDHYASIRPLGQYTGIPEPVDLNRPRTIVNNNTNTNTNNQSKKTTAKKIPSELMSDTEKMIMSSTGCDYDLVTSVLKDHNGDVESTIEYLIQIKQMGYDTVDSLYNEEIDCLLYTSPSPRDA
eukprot:TRINITY_DN15518_c0_g1_i1.p1 TRINITY_DN15518_c0_g1~~TRINITY_DN15518_c0_g1_i1.p1  ORF type:complete len:174 (+),score=44.85 TRINITY_DN15518_c0_g1_i1:3-524(+)